MTAERGDEHRGATLQHMRLQCAGHQRRANQIDPHDALPIRHAGRQPGDMRHGVQAALPGNHYDQSVHHGRTADVTGKGRGLVTLLAQTLRGAYRAVRIGIDQEQPMLLRQAARAGAANAAAAADHQSQLAAGRMRNGSTH